MRSVRYSRPDSCLRRAVIFPDRSERWMYRSTADNTSFLSALHPESSAKARVNSRLSAVNSSGDFSELMRSPSQGYLGDRHLNRKSQRLFVGILFPVTILCSTGWTQHSPDPLRTQRDRDLDEILSLVPEPSEQPFLIERNTQLNNLRRQYLERIEQPDWAADLSLLNTTGLNTNSKLFTGTSGYFRNVVQFSANWQTNVGWSFSGLQIGRVPTQYSSDSDLPRLDHLQVTYGKQRSIEVSAGLPEEEALLLKQKAYSLFSGLSVQLHPLDHKLSTSSTQTTFIFEHGWANLLAPIGSGPSRKKLQRTRPKLSNVWKLNSSELKTVAALEWYSDSDGVLGRISGRRPNAANEVENSNERRWRLFLLSADYVHSPWDDFSWGLSFQRVSNSLGKSASPSWSTSLNVEHQRQFQLFLLKPEFKITRFWSPAGAIPPLRLPLEMTPGSQGYLAHAGMSITSSASKNHEFYLSLNGLFQKQTETGVLLQCTLWGQHDPQTCGFGWISLAWSLKLPTNL